MLWTDSPDSVRGRPGATHPCGSFAAEVRGQVVVSYEMRIEPLQDSGQCRKSLLTAEASLPRYLLSLIHISEPTRPY